MQPVSFKPFPYQQVLDSATLQQIAQNITVPTGANHLLGATLHHGTALEHCQGILWGPKPGLGGGFGDEGIYFSVNNPRLAELYAKSATDTFPRILEGKLNPDKSYVVGRITIVQGGRSTDLKSGLWPHDWHKNPTLKSFVDKNFDILEIKAQAGVDPFICVKPRAGADAVRIHAVFGPNATKVPEHLIPGLTSSASQQGARRTKLFTTHSGPQPLSANRVTSISPVNQGVPTGTRTPIQMPSGGVKAVWSLFKNILLVETFKLGWYMGEGIAEEIDIHRQANQVAPYLQNGCRPLLTTNELKVLARGAINGSINWFSRMYLGVFAPGAASIDPKIAIKAAPLDPQTREMYQNELKRIETEWVRKYQASKGGWEFSFEAGEDRSNRPCLTTLPDYPQEAAFYNQMLNLDRAREWYSKTNQFSEHLFEKWRLINNSHAATTALVQFMDHMESVQIPSAISSWSFSQQRQWENTMVSRAESFFTAAATPSNSNGIFRTEGELQQQMFSQTSSLSIQEAFNWPQNGAASTSLAFTPALPLALSPDLNPLEYSPAYGIAALGMDRNQQTLPIYLPLYRSLPETPPLHLASVNLQGDNRVEEVNRTEAAGTEVNTSSSPVNSTATEFSPDSPPPLGYGTGNPRSIPNQPRNQINWKETTFNVSVVDGSIHVNSTTPVRANGYPFGAGVRVEIDPKALWDLFMGNSLEKKVINQLKKSVEHTKKELSVIDNQLGILLSFFEDCATGNMDPAELKAKVNEFSSLLDNEIKKLIRREEAAGGGSDYINKAMELNKVRTNLWQLADQATLENAQNKCALEAKEKTSDQLNIDFHKLSGKKFLSQEEKLVLEACAQEIRIRAKSGEVIFTSTQLEALPNIHMGVHLNPAGVNKPSSIHRSEFNGGRHSNSRRQERVNKWVAKLGNAYEDFCKLARENPSKEALEDAQKKVLDIIKEGQDHHHGYKLYDEYGNKTGTVNSYYASYISSIKSNMVETVGSAKAVEDGTTPLLFSEEEVKHFECQTFEKVFYSELCKPVGKMTHDEKISHLNKWDEAKAQAVLHMKKLEDSAGPLTESKKTSLQQSQWILDSHKTKAFSDGYIPLYYSPATNIALFILNDLSRRHKQSRVLAGMVWTTDAVNTFVPGMLATGLAWSHAKICQQKDNVRILQGLCWEKWNTSTLIPNFNAKAPFNKQIGMVQNVIGKVQFVVNGISSVGSATARFLGYKEKAQKIDKAASDVSTACTTVSKVGTCAAAMNTTVKYFRSGVFLSKFHKLRSAYTAGIASAIASIWEWRATDFEARLPKNTGQWSTIDSLQHKAWTLLKPCPGTLPVSKGKALLLSKAPDILCLAAALPCLSAMTKGGGDSSLLGLLGAASVGAAIFNIFSSGYKLLFYNCADDALRFIIDNYRYHKKQDDKPAMKKSIEDLRSNLTGMAENDTPIKKEARHINLEYVVETYHESIIKLEEELKAARKAEDIQSEEVEKNLLREIARKRDFIILCSKINLQDGGESCTYDESLVEVAEVPHVFFMRCNALLEKCSADGQFCLDNAKLILKELNLVEKYFAKKQLNLSEEEAQQEEYFVSVKENISMFKNNVRHTYALTQIDLSLEKNDFASIVKATKMTFDNDIASCVFPRYNLEVIHVIEAFFKRYQAQFYLCNDDPGYCLKESESIIAEIDKAGSYFKNKISRKGELSEENEVFLSALENRIDVAKANLLVPYCCFFLNGDPLFKDVRQALKIFDLVPKNNRSHFHWLVLATITEQILKRISEGQQHPQTPEAQYIYELEILHIVCKESILASLDDKSKIVELSDWEARLQLEIFKDLKQLNRSFDFSSEKFHRESENFHHLMTPYLLYLLPLSLCPLS